MSRQVTVAETMVHILLVGGLPCLTEHSLHDHQRDGVGVRPGGAPEGHGERALGGVGEAIMHVRASVESRLLELADDRKGTQTCVRGTLLHRDRGR